MPDPQHPEALHIRRARQDDYPQWKILWDDYNAFYGRSGATALPLAITQSTWSRIHAADEPVHALVAESDGRLLGLAHYLYHRNTILIGLALVPFVLSPLCVLVKLSQVSFVGIAPDDWTVDQWIQFAGTSTALGSYFARD